MILNQTQFSNHSKLTYQDPSTNTDKRVTQLQEYQATPAESINLKVKTDSNTSSSRSGENSSKPVISFPKDFDIEAKIPAQFT